MNSDQHQTISPCAILECNNESCVLCHCCEENYCFHHLIEHKNSNGRQLNSLSNDINKLNNRIKTINIQPLIKKCREKLELWRADCYHKIDDYVERKSHEIHRLLDEKLDHQQVEINRLRSTVADLTHKQDINNDEFYALKLTIHDVQKELETIEEIYNGIEAHPLAIAENLIDTNISNEDKFHRSSLSKVSKTINHPYGSSGILANNDKFILAYLAPNLILIDKQLNIIKQSTWQHTELSNICWSPTLNRFVLIEKNNIYLVDDRQMSIENLSIPEKRIWFACTCSDTSLFLSVDEKGSSVMEFHLLPSIKLAKQWKSPYTCAKNEYIDDIAYDNLTLALIITNKTEKFLRMELRSSKNFQRIWLFQFDMEYAQRKLVRCCPINFNEWLVADYQNRRVLHLSNDGNLKAMIQYNAVPYHIVLFGSHILAISRNNGINFHRV